MASVSLLCMLLYLLGNFKVAGLGPYKYQFEWAWFTMFVAYYLIFAWLFCFDNVPDELREYAHYAFAIFVCFDIFFIDQIRAIFRLRSRLQRGRWR